MALKIVYQTCCGIDVHKTFVVACIATTNKQGVTTYKRHRFSTFTQALPSALAPLLSSQLPLPRHLGPALASPEDSLYLLPSSGTTQT